MFTNLKKSEKGFTLIELLIVVAIIGILAAIAIPQFSAYRIRGYNSAANADMRNSRTAMEAFFSDWQGYPSTAAGGGAGLGALKSVVAGNVVNLAAAAIVDTVASKVPASATSITFPLSAGVLLDVNTTTVGGQNFVMVTRNTAGDRCYAGDSESSIIYWTNGVAGVAMSETAIPASTDANDFIELDVDGVPTGAATSGGAGCDGLSGNTGVTTFTPVG